MMSLLMPIRKLFPLYYMNVQSFLFKKQIMFIFFKKYFRGNYTSVNNTPSKFYVKNIIPPLNFIGQYIGAAGQICF